MPDSYSAWRKLQQQNNQPYQEDSSSLEVAPVKPLSKNIYQESANIAREHGITIPSEANTEWQNMASSSKEFESQYATNLSQDQYWEVDELKAQRQSGLDQFANSGLKALYKTVSTFGVGMSVLPTLGMAIVPTVWDFVTSVAQDDTGGLLSFSNFMAKEPEKHFNAVSNNAFINKVAEWDNYLQTEYPNYETLRAQNRNVLAKAFIPGPGFVNFWGNLLEQGGFAVGTYAAAMVTEGLGSLLTGVAVAAKATGETQAVLRALEGTTKVLDKGRNALPELINSSTSSEDLVNKLITAGRTIKSANTISNTAARTVSAITNGSINGNQSYNDFKRNQYENIKITYGREATPIEAEKIEDHANAIARNVSIMTSMLQVAQDQIIFGGQFIKNYKKDAGNIGKNFKNIVNKETGESISSDILEKPLMSLSGIKEVAVREIGKPEKIFRAIKGSLINASSEAIEEQSEQAIQTGVDNYYTNIYNNKNRNKFEDAMSSVMYGLNQGFHTKEGWEKIAFPSFIMGAIGMPTSKSQASGKFMWVLPMRGGIWDYVGENGKYAAEQEVTNDAVKFLNKYVLGDKVVNEQTKSFFEYIANEGEYDNSIKNGDHKKARDIKMKELISLVRTAKTTDMFDVLIQRYEESKDINVDEYKTITNTPKDVEVTKADITKKFDRLIKEAKRINENIDLIDNIFTENALKGKEAILPGDKETQQITRDGLIYSLSHAQDAEIRESELSTQLGKITNGKINYESIRNISTILNSGVVDFNTKLDTMFNEWWDSNGKNATGDVKLEVMTLLKDIIGLKVDKERNNSLFNRLLTKEGRDAYLREIIRQQSVSLRDDKTIAQRESELNRLQKGDKITIEKDGVKINTVIDKHPNGELFFETEETGRIALNTLANNDSEITYTIPSDAILNTQRKLVNIDEQLNGRTNPSLRLSKIESEKVGLLSLQQELERKIAVNTDIISSLEKGINDKTDTDVNTTKGRIEIFKTQNKSNQEKLKNINEALEYYKNEGIFLKLLQENPNDPIAMNYYDNLENLKEVINERLDDSGNAQKLADNVEIVDTDESDNIDERNTANYVSKRETAGAKVKSPFTATGKSHLTTETILPDGRVRYETLFIDGKPAQNETPDQPDQVDFFETISKKGFNELFDHDVEFFINHENSYIESTVGIRSELFGDISTNVDVSNVDSDKYVDNVVDIKMVVRKDGKYLRNSKGNLIFTSLRLPDPTNVVDTSLMEDYVKYRKDIIKLLSNKQLRNDTSEFEHLSADIVGKTGGWVITRPNIDGKRDGVDVRNILIPANGNVNKIEMFFAIPDYKGEKNVGKIDLKDPVNKDNTFQPLRPGLVYTYILDSNGKRQSTQLLSTKVNDEQANIVYELSKIALTGNNKYAKFNEPILPSSKGRMVDSLIGRIIVTGGVGKTQFRVKDRTLISEDGTHTIIRHLQFGENNLTLAELETVNGKQLLIEWLKNTKIRQVSAERTRNNEQFYTLKINDKGVIVEDRYKTYKEYVFRENDPILLTNVADIRPELIGNGQRANVNLTVGSLLNKVSKIINVTEENAKRKVEKESNKVNEVGITPKSTVKNKKTSTVVGKKKPIVRFDDDVSIHDKILNDFMSSEEENLSQPDKPVKKIKITPNEQDINKNNLTGRKPKPLDHGLTPGPQNRLADPLLEFYTQEDLKLAEEFIKSKLPGSPDFKIIKGLIDGKAFGQTTDMCIKLSDIAEVGTGYHEAFEYIARHVLSDEELNSLYNELRKKDGNAYTNDEAREILAEEFRDFKLNDGKSRFTDNDKAKKTVFQRILDFVKGILGINNSKDYDTIIQVFNKLNNGSYKDNPVIFKIQDNNIYQPYNREVGKLSVKETHDVVSSIVTTMVSVACGEVANGKFNSNTLDFTQNNNDGKKLRLDIFKEVMRRFDNILFDKDYQEGDHPILEELARNREELMNRIDDYYNMIGVESNTELQNDKNVIQDVDLNVKDELDAKELESTDDVDGEPKNTEDTIVEEKYQGWTESYFIQHIKNVPMSIKFLIATTPQLVKSGDTFLPVINAIRLSKPVNFNAFYKSMLQHLNGVYDYDKMITILRNEAKNIPEYTSIIRRLTTGGSLESRLKLQNDFFRSFGIMNTPIYDTVLEENGNVKLYDARVATSNDKIKEAWRTSFEDSDIIKLIDISNISESVSKVNKIINSFLKNGNVDKANELANFIGFDISDINTIDTNTKDNLKRVAVEVLRNVLDMQDKSTDKKQVLFNSIKDLFALGKISTRVNQLIDFKAKNYKDSGGEDKALNSENQPIYPYTSPNFLALVTDTIRNSDSFEEVLQKLPYLNDIYQYSRWLQHINNNWDTAHQNIDKIVLSGMRLRDAHSKGVSSDKLHISDAATQIINSMFNFTSGGDIDSNKLMSVKPLKRMSDSPREYGIVGLPLVIEITPGVIKDVFYNYLRHELHTGDGKKFWFFQEILHADTKAELEKEYMAGLDKGVFDKLSDDATDNELKRLIERDLFGDDKYEGFFSKSSKKFLEGLLDNQVLLSSSIRREYKIKNADINDEGLKVFSDVFVLNHIISTIEQQLILFGHPKYFKPESFYKRIRGVTGTGIFCRNDSSINKEFLTHYQNRSTTVGQNRKDIIDRAQKNTDVSQNIGLSNCRISMIPDIYTDGTKFLETVGRFVDDINNNPESSYMSKAYTKNPDYMSRLESAYKSVNISDGQLWTNIDFYRELAIRFNQWTDKHEESYKKIIKGDFNVNPNEQPAYFHVIKIMISGHMSGRNIVNADGKFEKQNGNRPGYVKCAVAPIIETSLSKNTKAMNYLNSMQESGVNIIGHESAFKFLELDEIMKNNHFNGDTKQLLNSYELPLQYVKLQVEKNAEVKDSFVDLLQGRKTPFHNSFNNGIAVNQRVGVIKQQTNSIYKELVNREVNNLMKDLGVTNDGGVYTINDDKKFTDGILKEFKKRTLPDNVRDAITYNEETGKLAFKVDATNCSEVLTHILFARINHRVIRLKVNSTANTQISPAIYDAKDAKYGSETLQYKLDGTTEVYLPNWMSRLYKGKNVVIDPELLSLYGLRVPCDGVHSMLSMRIKVDKNNNPIFLPEEYGDTIVTPWGFYPASGSDNDNDMMYTVRYFSKHTEDTNTGIHYYDKINAYDEYFEKQINSNEKFATWYLTEGRILRRAQNRLSDINAKNIDLTEDVLSKFKEFNVLTRKQFNETALTDSAILETISAESLHNYRTDLYIEMLKMEHNVLQSLSPNNADTIVGIADKIKHKLYPNKYNENGKPKSQTFTDILDFWEERLIAQKYSIAKESVSRIANQISFSQLTQESGLEGIEVLSDGMSVILNYAHNNTSNNNYYGGKIKFGSILDVDKKVISDQLSEIMTCDLDVTKEKHDLLFDLNVNQLTEDLAAFMLKTGCGLDRMIAFINQPIIRDFIKQKMSNMSNVNTSESRYNNFYKGNKFENDDNIIRDLFTKYFPADEDIAYVSKINQAYIERNHSYNRKDSGEEKYTINDMMNVIGKGDELLVSDNNSFRKQQIELFKDFIAYQKYAKLYSNGILSSRDDAVGAGKSMVQARIMQERKNDVINNGLFSNYEKLLSTTTVAPFYEVALKLPLEMYRDLFISENQELQNKIFSKIKSNLKIDGYLDIVTLTKAVRDLINNFMQEGVNNGKSFTIQDYKDSFISTKDNKSIARILKGIRYTTPNSIKLQRDILSNLESLEQTPETTSKIEKVTKNLNDLDRNLRALQNPIISELLIPMVADKDGVENINIFYNRLSTIEADSYTKAFDELRETFPILYKWLKKISIMQSGVNTNQLHYLRYLPAQDIIKSNEPTLNKWESYFDSGNNMEPYIPNVLHNNGETFMDNFYLNNPGRLTTPRVYVQHDALVHQVNIKGVMYGESALLLDSKHKLNGKSIISMYHKESNLDMYYKFVGENEVGESVYVRIPKKGFGTRQEYHNEFLSFRNSNNPKVFFNGERRLLDQATFNQIRDYLLGVNKNEVINKVEKNEIPIKIIGKNKKVTTKLKAAKQVIDINDMVSDALRSGFIIPGKTVDQQTTIKKDIMLKSLDELDEAAKKCKKINNSYI